MAQQGTNQPLSDLLRQLNLLLRGWTLANARRTAFRDTRAA